MLYRDIYFREYHIYSILSTASSYGYIYLAMIWVIIKNWKEYKNKQKDILFIAIILAIEQY